MLIVFQPAVLSYIPVYDVESPCLDCNEHFLIFSDTPILPIGFTRIEHYPIHHEVSTGRVLFRRLSVIRRRPEIREETHIPRVFVQGKPSWIGTWVDPAEDGRSGAGQEGGWDWHSVRHLISIEGQNEWEICTRF